MADNKRLLMVKGSKWRITQDATIMHTKENDLYKKEFSDWEKLNYDKYKGLYEERQKDAAAFVTKVLGIKPTVEVEWGKVTAGTEFEITGKSTNSMYTTNPFTVWSGIYFPVTVLNGPSKGKKVNIPYKGFEPLMELTEAIEVCEYVIRASSTGKIFAGVNYDRPEIWSNKLQAYIANPDYDADNVIKYADTFMKGKRWKDAGKPKLYVLDSTGYYENMPGGQRPDWLGDGSKQFDLPKDWEIVKFDKLTKKEVEVIDIQKWFERAWQLRELTIKFGSPVRSLYNELDKKGKLDTFKGMLVVRSNITEYHPGTSYASSYYDDELDPKDVAELDQLIEQFGFKSKDLKRAKDPNCVAVAFANTNAALRLKLAYSGKLQFGIIDLETLKETVNA